MSRCRYLLAVVVVGVVLAGCVDTSTESTTTTSVPIDTTTVGTTVDTTAVATTTTTPSTTSTTAAPVTDDPFLPAALGRDQVPWDQVGDGWYMVQYDSSKAYPTSQSDVREGPVVLYLVNRSGELFEVASWPAGSYPTLLDATSSAALVARSEGEHLDRLVYEHVDLITGNRSTVFAPTGSESLYVNLWPAVSLTRPTGSHVVVYRSDGVTQWLERRAPDGTLLTTVFEQGYEETPYSMAWLYGHEGTSMIIAHRGGVTLVGLEGASLGELWSPPDTFCDPMRWWDEDTLLATCFGLGPSSAPVDDSGNPHTYYGRLWLLETDGTPGLALTEYPPEPPIVVDFGYHDAWPSGDDIYLQWWGDCGAAQVAMLQPDGLGEFVGVTPPAGLAADGVRMVDIVGDEMTLFGWQGCGDDVGALFTVSLDGVYRGTLVDAVDDARGVTDVVALGEVYP